MKKWIVANWLSILFALILIGLLICLWLIVRSDENKTPEWFLGLIGGFLCTAYGFVLTMIWDNSKMRREQKEKDDTIILAGLEEHKTNIEILSVNLALISKELSLMEQKGTTIVRPLRVLHHGFWDMVKSNIPKILVGKNDILYNIRQMALITDEVNLLIHNRENYRIHNRAMSGYKHCVKQYDEMLIVEIARWTELSKDKLAPEFEKWEKLSSG